MLESIISTSNDSVKIPSSLVTVTVITLEPESKSAGANAVNNCERESPFAIVITEFIGVTSQPSGMLSESSIVNESSPFPVLSSLNPKVLLPPAPIPIASSCSEISNPNIYRT
jgi:hypothetical protein